LLQLAGPGETLLDDAVHAAVQGIARCEPVDARVKGIDAPLRVWRLQEIGEGATANVQAFVGRQGELAQLTALLRNCVASGRGGAVLVRGDAGMGKSRLIGELRRAAQTEGFAHHIGLVLDFGVGKGRDAIRELVAGMLDLAPDAPAETRLAALESYAFLSGLFRLWLIDRRSQVVRKQTRKLLAAHIATRRPC